MTKAIGREAASFFSVEEAASLLKVRDDTLRRWLRNGTLRGVKINRLWRISQAEMERLRHAEPPAEAQSIQDAESRVLEAVRRAGWSGDDERLRQELRRALREAPSSTCE